MEDSQFKIELDTKDLEKALATLATFKGAKLDLGGEKVVKQFERLKDTLNDINEEGQEFGAAMDKTTAAAERTTTARTGAAKKDYASLFGSALGSFGSNISSISGGQGAGGFVGDAVSNIGTAMVGKTPLGMAAGLIMSAAKIFSSASGKIKDTVNNVLLSKYEAGAYGQSDVQYQARKAAFARLVPGLDYDALSTQAQSLKESPQALGPLSLLGLQNKDFAPETLLSNLKGFVKDRSDFALPNEIKDLISQMGFKTIAQLRNFDSGALWSASGQANKLLADKSQADKFKYDKSKLLEIGQRASEIDFSDAALVRSNINNKLVEELNKLSTLAAKSANTLLDVNFWTQLGAKAQEKTGQLYDKFINKFGAWYNNTGDRSPNKHINGITH